MAQFLYLHWKIIFYFLQPDALNYTFTIALQEYEKIIDTVASEGMSVVTPEIKSDWDYIQSAFFASTVLTTIGKLLYMKKYACNEMSDSDIYTHQYHSTRSLSTLALLEF